MTNAATPAALAITDDLKAAVNGALDNSTPMLIAYVDLEGQPSLSFRGSTQVYSDNQLGVWIRNPEGGLIKSFEKNPKVTMLYRDGATRSTLQFKGRAYVANDEENRQKVYDMSPKREQDADPEKKGVPIIIDLDLVIGTLAGARVLMARQ